MEKNKTLQDFGKQIAIKRMKANMTQWALAKKIGIDQAHVVKYEQGKINPSMETAMAFAQALGCHLEIKFIRDRRRKERAVEEETKARN